MYSIASTDEGFVNAGTSEDAITKVFSDIATDIQYKACDVTLTDMMGTGFTYYTDTEHQPSLTVTASDDNKTVTWNVVNKLGNETKTLTFYVQYDKQNLTEAATLPTNTSASLSYKDSKGNAQTDITVASPEIENLAKMVTYVDENDDKYTDAAHEEKLYWYGDKVDLAGAPQKDGYTFSGWTTSDVTIDQTDASFEMPKQNVTLKASWTKNEPTTKTITVVKEWDKDVTDKQKLPVEITLYRTVGNRTYTADDAIATLTLDGEVDDAETAAWTGVFKDLPVKNDKGETYGYAVAETKIGSLQVTNSSANVTRDNTDGTSSYTIGTWSVSMSRTGGGPYKFTNEYHSADTYTLTYQYVGTTPSDVTSAPDVMTNLYADQKIDLAQVTTSQTGWTFDGWYSDSSCAATTKVSDPYTMPAANTTLYGEWSYQAPQPDKVTLSFEFKNGTNNEELPEDVTKQTPTSEEKEAGENVTLTRTFDNVEVEGEGTWTFEGWYSDEDCTKGNEVTSPYTVTENTTLYGKWTFTENKPEPQPSLNVTKSVDKEKGEVGEMITYTITVKNDGEVDLDNITLTDTFNGKGTLYSKEDKSESVTLDEDGKFTVNIDKLAADEYATYNYYYWIDAEDEGTITNAAVAKSGDTEDDDKTETKVDRGDVDGYEVSGWITKIVESKKGTFKKTAAFTFNIWADKDCTDLLDTIEIEKDWDVAKDDSDDETETFSFEISENDFDELDEVGDYKVIYVTEREGSIKGMTYDDDVVPMYLLERKVVVNSLNIEGYYDATANPLMDNDTPATFTNTYKKPGEKGETIKSGPQLNRDDHVAYIMGTARSPAPRRRPSSSAC